MTTDLNATDTAIGMTESYRLEKNGNAELKAELAVVRTELQACEERRAASAAENRRLRKQIASGRCPDCDAIERSLALNEDPDDGRHRQLNDVLDVEPGLSAALTRHEGESW